MAYDGNRFDHSRPDVNSANGKLVTTYIAIAEPYEEAATLVFDMAPDPSGVRFVGHGGQLLQEAQKAGIAEGQAGIVS